MEQSMKIYEIGTGYTPIPARMGAATEIVVEELTKSFLKKGIPVEIIDIAAQSRAENTLPIREVRVPSCFSGTDVKLGLLHKLKRVVYSVCLTATLRKLLKKETERVVLHFHNQYNLFFFLKLTSRKLRRKAVIAYTNHSGIWRQDWSVIEETIRKRYFQEAECMRRADIVFLLNKETKENVVTHLGVPEDRLVLIGNGVNTDVYHPLTEDQKQIAREKWDLQDRRVILQVGSVYENKGQLRTVEYLLPLLKKHPDLVFVYAGGIVDEEYQQKVLSYAAHQGLEKQVRYLGMVSPGRELNELYNTAHLTILNSNYEGFSLVSIESCAAGIPVLTNSMVAEAVGDGSLVFDKEFAIPLILMQEAENYTKLCVSARENAVCNFSWDIIADTILSRFTILVSKIG